MSTVFLTIGAPASGKSTYARKFVKDHGNAMLTCRDDIRLAHGLESGENENFVTRVQRQQIEVALLDGMDVVVADTNLNPKFRQKMIKFCHEHGADVQLVYFPISLDEAILRDRNRANTVGPVIVKRFYDMFVQQGFMGKEVAEQESVPAPSFEPYTEAGDKWEAIVVDIDGTLADKGDRNPYDESKVMQDVLVRPVAMAVNGLQDYSNAKVIIVSGRSDACRADTEQWLRNHGIEYHALYMRKHGDTRPDYVIKNEIYDKHILPNYDVLVAFDDRDQVVRHVRKRGITVFQVGYGRF